jgi:probable blue pigment (indigoidine) exporter
MEASKKWVAITAIAPIAWGSNYYVTRQFLPDGSPLYGAALRALPAGVVLLAIARVRPHGEWWWKSMVLGVLNVGAFFVLIYLAAQLLPSNVASVLMALSAAVMALLAWALLGERPRVRALGGAVIGLAGVGVMLLGGPAVLSPLGVAASVAAMFMSSLGYILARRWGQDIELVALTAWQLIAGGVLLLPFAVATEGGPPSLTPSAALAFGYVSLVATAVAFLAWFAGLRHLDAGTVGLLGLLNPLAGVILGSVVAAESFGPRQAIGAAVVIAGMIIGRVRGRRRLSVRYELCCPPVELGGQLGQQAGDIGQRVVADHGQRLPGRAHTEVEQLGTFRGQRDVERALLGESRDSADESAAFESLQ